MGSLPIKTVVRSVAVDTVNPERVYTAGPAGLFRSDDAGQKWSPADDGRPTEPYAVTLHPAQPQTVLSSTTPTAQ